jgi:hypothetical protein
MITMQLHYGAPADKPKIGHIWTDEGGKTHGQLGFTGVSDVASRAPRRPGTSLCLLPSWPLAWMPRPTGRGRSGKRRRQQPSKIIRQASGPVAVGKR